MSDEDALLAAITANPDDDTPRLVYADWLDENGDADRAEFIRLQCAPQGDEITRKRAAGLEQRNRARWLAKLPQFTRKEFDFEPGGDWGFRRGFPEQLTVSVYRLLQRYNHTVRVPWLRALSLRNVDEYNLQDFVNRPWNPRWVELEFQARAVPGGYQLAPGSTQVLVAVADCRQVAQLRQLRFSLFEQTAESILALATSPYLGGLQQLHLDYVTDHAAIGYLETRFGDRLVIG